MDNGTVQTPPAPSTLMPHYLGWYIFIALFLAVSLRHKRDMARNPSVFDFAKFSLASGTIHPLFFKIKLPGIETNYRSIECLLEPLPFFIAGVLLALIGQALGWLLIVVSIYYGMGYVAAYHIGDNFVMDKIDEMIVNQKLERAFVDEASEDETLGFRFRGKRPDDREMRKKIMPLMVEDDEVFEAS
jgi:hypothetical protein